MDRWLGERRKDRQRGWLWSSQREASPDRVGRGLDRPGPLGQQLLLLPQAGQVGRQPTLLIRGRGDLSIELFQLGPYGFGPGRQLAHPGAALTEPPPYRGELALESRRIPADVVEPLVGSGRAPNEERTDQGSFRRDEHGVPMDAMLRRRLGEVVHQVHPAQQRGSQAPDPRVGANGLYQRTLTGDAGWCWAILSRRDCLDREDQPAGA